MGFPPVSRPDARLLILGTLPGVQSLQRQQYYAHPQNGFWRIMAALTGKALPPDYAGRTALLIDHRIALWDVGRSAHRPGSLDSAITEMQPNDFAGFFQSHPQLALIGFNGQPAAKLFRRLVGNAPVDQVVLPSTSPAHAGMTLARKAELWAAALLPVMTRETATDGRLF